jgi:hypothetical protein
VAAAGSTGGGDRVLAECGSFFLSGHIQLSIPLDRLPHSQASVSPKSWGNDRSYIQESLSKGLEPGHRRTDRRALGAGGN